MTNNTTTFYTLNPRPRLRIGHYLILIHISLNSCLCHFRISPVLKPCSFFYNSYKNINEHLLTARECWVLIRACVIAFSQYNVKRIIVSSFMRDLLHCMVQIRVSALPSRTLQMTSPSPLLPFAIFKEVAKRKKRTTRKL